MNPIDDVADIAQMMEHIDLLDRGLVAEIRPLIPAVETHVETCGVKSLHRVFLDLDDETGGLAAIADPDELVDFGAVSEHL
jgi:hypothetical protein